MKCAIVDYRISEKAERGLITRGFLVIKMPACPSLSKAVCAHPDMLLFKHGDNIITSAAYCEQFPIPFTDMREYSSKLSFLFSSEEHKEEYPSDAIFNALVIGERIFIKTDSAFGLGINMQTSIYLSMAEWLLLWP